MTHTVLMSAGHWHKDWFFHRFSVKIPAMGMIPMIFGGL